MNRFRDFAYEDAFRDEFANIERTPLEAPYGEAVKKVMDHLNEIATLIDIFDDEPEFQATLGGIVYGASITLPALSGIKNLNELLSLVIDGMIGHAANVGYVQELESRDYYSLLHSMGKFSAMVSRRLKKHSANSIMNKITSDFGDFDDEQTGKQVQNLLKFLRSIGGDDDADHSGKTSA